MIISHNNLLCFVFKQNIEIYFENPINFQWFMLILQKSNSVTFFSKKIYTMIFFLFIYIIVWLSFTWISCPNLDFGSDMIENVAWGQVFQWGSHKHPPALGWITRLWFSIFPTTHQAYYALSFFNSAIGLLGVYFISRLLKLYDAGITAVLLLSMSIPYSFLAKVFNANSILLGIWPWVIWAYLKSNTNSKSKVASMILGFLTAIAILAKYYSCILALSILIISLIDKENRNWYKTPNPYIALGTFLITLVPHLFWLFNNDFPTFKYVSMKSSESQGISWKGIASFGFLPIYYWIIPWIVISACWQKKFSWKIFCKNLFTCWALDLKSYKIFFIVMMPWLVSMIIGLTGTFRLISPYGLPIGYGFALLWISNLSKHNNFTLHEVERKVIKFFIGFLFIVILLSPFNLFVDFKANRAKYLPREEMAKEFMKILNNKYPNKQLAWVGGQWADNAVFAFYVDKNIRIIPDFPDCYPGNLSDYKEWKDKLGILFRCLGSTEASDGIAEEDIKNYENWIKSQGKDPQTIRLKVHRKGLYLKKQTDYEYAAVVYVP